MIESIKLTADDFDYIHCDKDSCGPELFELLIYGTSESDCNTIKQHILENQEITHDIREIITKNPYSDEDKAIIKYLKEILSENKNLDFNKIPGEKQ